MPAKACTLLLPTREALGGSTACLGLKASSLMSLSQLIQIPHSEQPEFPTPHPQTSPGIRSSLESRVTQKEPNPVHSPHIEQIIH